MLSPKCLVEKYLPIVSNEVEKSLGARVLHVEVSHPQHVQYHWKPSVGEDFGGRSLDSSRGTIHSGVVDQINLSTTDVRDANS